MLTRLRRMSPARWGRFEAWLYAVLAFMSACMGIVLMVIAGLSYLHGSQVWSDRIGSAFLGGFVLTFIGAPALFMAASYQIKIWPKNDIFG